MDLPFPHNIPERNGEEFFFYFYIIYAQLCDSYEEILFQGTFPPMIKFGGKLFISID